MKQTHIEGTEPITKGKRTARELANDAAAKRHYHLRRAVLAEEPGLNKLVLAIKHSLELSTAPAMADVREHLLKAGNALDSVIDELIGA